MRDFKEKLKLVPELPGSYKMKDEKGYIIYVGKAKNLKKRVSSYFRGNATGKTAMLVEDIADFEYIVTSSELESLILEINLIKTSPKAGTNIKKRNRITKITVIRTAFNLFFISPLSSTLYISLEVLIIE